MLPFSLEGAGIQLIVYYDFVVLPNLLYTEPTQKHLLKGQPCHFSLSGG